MAILGGMTAGASGALAAVFAHDDLTPAGAGVANAVVAAGDDISAAIYNPAGLAWQEGVQVLVGSQSNSPTIGVDIAGVGHSGDGSFSDIAVFALSWLPEGGQWGAAASVSTPYALFLDWRGQFTPPLGQSGFDMQRYSVDTFYRVNNTLGLSAGLDIYDSTLRLQSGAVSFSARNWSPVTAHVGARWAFMPFWSMGLTYRKGTDVRLSQASGDAMDITLPDVLTLGVAHDLANDEMRLELDVTHSRWSSFSGLKVQNGGTTSINLPASLRDTTDVALGWTWFWRQNTQLRLGYAYLQGANDTAAYQPAIADLTGHRFSAGFGGMMSGMHLDVTLTGVIYPKTDVSGSYAGTYKGSYHTWMFTLSKKF